MMDDYSQPVFSLRRSEVAPGRALEAIGQRLEARAVVLTCVTFQWLS